MSCALALGFLYAVINPPFAVNDERNHWLRVLDLSKGRLISRSNEQGPFCKIPVYYYEELILAYARLPAQPEVRVDLAKLVYDLTTRRELERTGQTKWKYTDAYASGYSPIPYLPHLPVVWLARMLTLPGLWQIYLARFASLLCYALLSAWAIAFAGELGWLLFVLGLMPMSLTQAAGLSADGMTNGLAFMFFALVAKGALRPGEALSRRELGWLAALGALLTLCKVPYALVGVALLTLRWEGARAGWRRLGYAAAALACSAASLGGWRYLNRGAPSAGPSTVDTRLAWLAEDLNGPRLLGHTLMTMADDYLIQLVAVRDLVNRQMPALGGAVAGVYLVLLGAVSWGACEPERLEPATRRRALLWLPVSALAVSILVFVGMYLLSTEVGSKVIGGVQGRYFIPIFPALLLTLGLFGRPSLSRWLSRHNGLGLVGIIALLNVVCLGGLIVRYYLPY